MANGKTGKMTRVAEGVYARDGLYYVPIWRRELNDGKGGKEWHSVGCGPECGHEHIVDLAAAKAAKRQLEERKRQSAGKPDETVREWSERWLRVFPRKGEITMMHNAERVRGFVKRFGDYSLRSLAHSEKEVWEWADDGPSAVKEVRAMLNDAMKLRLLDENPLRHYNLGQRRGRQDITTLTPAELDLLLEVAHEVHGDFGPMMAAMIETAAWSGVRPGELFLFSRRPGARVNYVDFDRGLIDVQWQWTSKLGKAKGPKWSSERLVALLPGAERALRGLDRIGGEDGLYFMTKRGHPYTARVHHYYWDPVRRAFTDRLPKDHWLPLRIQDLGVDRGNLDFYELRHFFGTALAHPPKGVPAASPYEIAQQMGHKDGGALAMKVYVHTEGENVVRDLRERWGNQEAAPVTEIAARRR